MENVLSLKKQLHHTPNYNMGWIMDHLIFFLYLSRGHVEIIKSNSQNSGLGSLTSNLHCFSDPSMSCVCICLFVWSWVCHLTTLTQDIYLPFGWPSPSASNKHHRPEFNTLLKKSFEEKKIQYTCFWFFTPFKSI